MSGAKGTGSGHSAGLEFHEVAAGAARRISVASGLASLMFSSMVASNSAVSSWNTKATWERIEATRMKDRPAQTIGEPSRKPRP